MKTLKTGLMASMYLSLIFLNITKKIIPKIIPLFYVYSTSQMFLNRKFFVFSKEAYSAHQVCIYLIQITAKIVNNLKYFLLFKITVFYLNVF